MAFKKTIFTLLLLAAYFETGFAMRCQQSLVYEGDSQYVVEKKCGAPLSKEVIDNPQVLFNGYGAPYTAYISYEVWIYQRSTNDFLYQVIFQDGVVKSITANRSS